MVYLAFFQVCYSDLVCDPSFLLIRYNSIATNRQAPLFTTPYGQQEMLTTLTLTLTLTFTLQWNKTNMSYSAIQG